MSAITGIYNYQDEPISLECARDLMSAFHRFPSDNIQTWSKQNTFLGCHAQWITPESVGEQLPYYDYERNLAITADAIIDNRNDLFAKLRIHEKDRNTIPDSRLILLAYYKWGEDVPKHLVGDFAFVIWDGREQKLFGARDFSGARTLYYFNDHKYFIFSTLIEPLFTFPFIEKRLNEEWLAEFLVIPTMVEAVDMTSTVYQRIQQLPPSHSITVKDGRVKLSRYLTLMVESKLKLKSNGEYVEAFKEVFHQAVKARIRTNGEVGSHLSGGLDSGTVVSFAAKELKRGNKQLHTYSYYPRDGFVDWTSKYYLPDERLFIKETVNHVGNIHDQYLNFEGRDPLTEVDDFLSLMEMPYKFFENAFWLKGISEIAQKDGVKILLNGARGNHSISWGSYRLNLEYYASLLKSLKWSKLYKELGLYCQTFHTGKSVMLPIISKAAFPRLNIQNQPDYHFPILINSSLARKTNVYEKILEYGIDPATGQMAESLDEHRVNHYKKLYVWNKSGVVNTKMSLRYSLWDRDPTNDINVIRFCMSLPDEQYVEGGMERSFLRKATKDILPDKVRLNHYVRGIQGADTIHRMSSQWSSLVHEIQMLMNDSAMNDLFDMNVVKSSLSYLGKEPQPDIIFSDEFKIVVRSLIVYRFIKGMKGGGKNEKIMEKPTVGCT